MTERPIECGHCRKPVRVIYKEISGGSTIMTEMCAECPILQGRLHNNLNEMSVSGEKEMNLCCNHCRTDLAAIKTGNPVGCVDCYSVFGDILVADLIETGSIPPALQKQLAFKRNQPIHVGHAPEKPINLPPESRRASLNEALNEALKKENYEQAAWIRDQMKTLMNNDGQSNPPPATP